MVGKLNNNFITPVQDTPLIQSFLSLYAVKLYYAIIYQAFLGFLHRYESQN